MVTSAFKILKASEAIQKLKTVVLPYRYTRDLMVLSSDLAREKDMIASSLNDKVVRHGGSIGADGSISFKRQESAKMFYEEYNSDFSEEIEVNVSPCDLSKCSGSISIDVNTLEALEGFVIFE